MTQVTKTQLLKGDKELAEFLGVCLSTVEKMNKKGVLDEARYKIGRKNAYDPNKVLQLLKY